MSVNKVQLANGETIIDISDSTVTPETLAEGVTAHDASGKKITGTMKSSGGLSVQADWNQTDETAADFIKNKTHYEVQNVILEEQEAVYVDDYGGCVVETSATISHGDVLSIMYDGVTYVSNVVSANGTAMFGNLAISEMGQDTGEPFTGVFMPGTLLFIPTDTSNHTVKVTIIGIVKLPKRYYDAQTVFYVNFSEQLYLYTDEACTTKAIKADIAAAAKIGYVSIAIMVNGAVGMICPLLAVNISDSYAKVTVFEDPPEGTSNIFSMFTFYTAEYAAT